MTLSPKNDFLSDKTRADVHGDIAASPMFKRACEVALLEYALKLNGEDPRTALKLHGAKMVLNILLNLSNPQFEPDSEGDFPHLKPI